MTVRGDLLFDACRAVDGDRNESYGDPKDNFEDTAALVNAYFGFDPALTAGDVAVFMILLKVARLRAAPGKKDTWQDIAGYAACGYEVVDAGLRADLTEEFDEAMAAARTVADYNRPCMGAGLVQTNTARGCCGQCGVNHG